MVPPNVQKTTTPLVLQLPDFLKVDHAWILIAVRLLVFAYPTTVAFSEWIPIVQSMLVDPIFSLHHVQEAVAIRELFSNQFAESYVGRNIHIPPLLLAAVECLVARGTWLLWTVVLVLDLRTAWNFQRLAESSLRHEFNVDTSEDELTAVMDERLRPQLSTVFPTSAEDTATRVPRHRIPVWMALLYLTVATLSNPHSFQSIPIFCLMEALVQPSLVSSAAWLALAAHVDVHCSIFLVPLVLLQQQQRRQHQSVTTTVVALVLFFTLLLQVCSYLLVGDQQYPEMVLATHFHSFRLQGMEPSLSVLWYFSMQVFRRFRLYFQLVLGGLPYCIVVPTTIRLYKYPSVLVRTRIRAPMKVTHVYFLQRLRSFGSSPCFFARR